MTAVLAVNLVGSWAPLLYSSAPHPVGGLLCFSDEMGEHPSRQFLQRTWALRLQNSIACSQSFTKSFLNQYLQILVLTPSPLGSKPVPKSKRKGTRHSIPHPLCSSASSSFVSSLSSYLYQNICPLFYPAVAPECLCLKTYVLRWLPTQLQTQRTLESQS